MKVVINISKDNYKRLKAGDVYAGNTFFNTILQSVANGVVLPEEEVSSIIEADSEED